MNGFYLDIVGKNKKGFSIEIDRVDLRLGFFDVYFEMLLFLLKKGACIETGKKRVGRIEKNFCIFIFF